MSALFLQNYLSSNLRFSKTTLKGWRTCNGQCCIHNNETPDKRGRAGFNFGLDGSIVYSCFNCGYKSSWKPGIQFSKRFKNLLHWYGIPESQVDMLNFEALELKASGEFSQSVLHQIEIPVEFPEEEIPYKSRYVNTITADECDNDFLDCVEYTINRNINFEKYNFLWSPATRGNFNRRIIVPFYYKNKLVGWSARSIDIVKPYERFVMQQPNGYVFNLNNQSYKSKYMVVCEGIFDAMTIDGVAVMHGEISHAQAALIESYGKEIVVVPDFDKSGRKLVDSALEFGWNVSFPVWGEDFKDINEAACALDKIFVLQNIFQSIESNPTKIKLLAKNAFKDKNK